MLASYLVDCVLSENIAFSGWGGAFYGVDSPYSQFVMLSSSFVNNRAYSSYFTQSHGGALMITSKITVNISDCFFANNSALPYLHVVPLTYRYPYSCSCCCCCPDSCCCDLQSYQLYHVIFHPIPLSLQWGRRSDLRPVRLSGREQFGLQEQLRRDGPAGQRGLRGSYRGDPLLPCAAHQVQFHCQRRRGLLRYVLITAP